MDTRFHIELIDDTNWSVAQDLIHDGWNNNHIFTKSEALLKWQYIGYGPHKNKGAFALYDDSKMIGFRLMIPIELSLSEGIDNKKRIVPAGVSTLYYIDEEYRGMKLGLKMQLYTIEHFGYYFAIASNLKTSAPIYKKSGAFMLDTMYRYVCPLSIDFKNILKIKTDVDFIFNPDKNIAISRDVDSDELFKIWDCSTKNENITSLARPSDFWNWRYKQSPIYKYHFFGSINDGGIIVGRIEKLYNQDKTVKNETVFRILEFIPCNSNVWRGEFDDKMSCLLNSVLAWAKEKGCVAAEFYISTNHFDSILSKNGFKEINIKKENIFLDCYSYFEPCCESTRLCNITVFATDYQGEFDFNNTYFTLSDADQDRPNILPYEAK